MIAPTLPLARPDTLRTSSVTQLLLLASFGLGIGAWGHFSSPYALTSAFQNANVAQVSREEGAGRGDAQPSLAEELMTAPRTALSFVESVAAPTARTQDSGQAVSSSSSQSVTREAELESGSTFAEMLADQGIARAEAMAAMNALAKAYDLRRLKAGQEVTLFFERSGAREVLTGAVFQPDDTKEVSIARARDGSYAAESRAIPVTRHRMAASAEIRSSLYEAGDRMNVPRSVMASLIRIYAHDIDFQRDIHAGDSFEVLYDQPLTSKGKAVGEGTVIYAALRVGGKSKPIYRVAFNDGTVDYFDDKGRSVRRALLRTPVAVARVTSGFGMRMHPILGYSTMHKGVDFGAPTGTPIFAAGGGVIEDIGFRNGYGRYIRIRHNGQIATAYAHMSRFNANLSRGARVNQGDVIGYVGMSGRSTGPHLHYEVMNRGAQVNPLSVNLPTGRILEGKQLAEFKRGQSKIRQEMSFVLGESAKVATVESPGSISMAGNLTPAATTIRAASSGAAQTRDH